MLKQMMATIGLGLTQLLPALVNAQESACCEPTVIVGEPLDPSCINPLYPYPASPALCNGWDLYATGDFLYFSALIDSFANTATDFAFDLSEAEYFFQKSPYRPGFRVSIGLDLDSVMFDFTYLRFHYHTTSHFNASGNSGVLVNYIAPTVLATLFGQPRVFFQNVKSTFRLDVDYALLSLRKPAYMGKRIISSLNYGLLGVWTGEKWNFDCTALNTFPPPGAGLTSNGVARANQKAWAVGPELGFRATGLIGCGFQALLNVDLSLMYGSCYKAFSTGSFPQAPIPIANNTINEREHASHLQAFHSSEIGLGWGSYFWCDRLHVDLWATYNFLFQHIFNYGIPFSPTGIDGMGLSNYSMHGIAIGGRIDF